MIATYIPENIQFAINLGVSKEWWVRPFLKLARTYPIDPNNPMAIKSLIEEVKKNKKIAIFPEGRISLTGALMKVYEGPAMIADKANATILPKVILSVSILKELNSESIIFRQSD